MPGLDLEDLHGSLRDPVLGSVSFLNEVMGRYPDAISFAPGAPHPAFLEALDTERCTERFLDHLVHDLGHTRGSARRMLFEYGPSRGLINHLVSDALRRDHRLAVSPEAVVVTSGAQEAMLLVLRALMSTPGKDMLAVADPSFVGIIGAARLLDIPLVGVPEADAGIDVDSLARQCRAARKEGRRIRACYVAPDFSNPGGRRLPMTCRRRLLDLAEREDFLILEDNAYGFTAPGSEDLPPLKAMDVNRRVVHIGTFAKICFPGARVGYVVADQPGANGDRMLAHELAALKTMVTVNTSPLSQAVIGGMLLEHGHSLAELGRRKAELYQRNLACLLDALDRHLPPGIEHNRPVGGFFVRVGLPVPADAALLQKSAESHGVLWTPMAQFHLDGAGDNQLRLSCSYLDPDRIETGVERLAAFLEKEIGA
jgi:(S)-3,5-dihydroxyphenylglycine transaminase